MFPTPKPALTPNTYAYESTPLVKPTGFREYDARWLLEKEINLMGVQALGLGLGTLIRELNVKPEIVTGHDFRSYSSSVKMALVSGLMASGCKVYDIGLAITPMAYFAQFDLNVPCVAMREIDGYTSAVALSLQQQDSATDEISHNVASAANGAKGMVSVLEEVTQAVGDTRSAAGKVLQASETVETAATSLQRGIEGFLGRVAV
jgi:Phosphomannomutase